MLEFIGQMLNEAKFVGLGLALGWVFWGRKPKKKEKN